MAYVVGLKCCACGKEYAVEEALYNCADCSGNLDVVYDYKKISKLLNKKVLAERRIYSHWRYLELLPVTDKSKIPPLQVGWTPLYKREKFGQRLGVPDLWFKDDGRNPSASFKDRASSVAIVRCLELGNDIICGASTGNAASSTACLTASIGLKTYIFVPKTAPKAKIAQLLVFGARVFAVNGSYDNAFDLCLEATAEFGWYNRNTGFNPYTREGKKTCAYEICEQLGWRVPDKVFVPVGDGNIISGVWKGFRDLEEVGLIDHKPQLIAVQSELSSAVVDAVLGDGKLRPVKATTLADSISVDWPRDGLMAVRAVKESGGTGVKVSDQEILEAIPEVARGAGIFGEPAGVTSYAGLKKMLASGSIKEGECAVCMITGNGLKDVDSAMRIAGQPISIEPKMGSLKEALKATPA